MTEEEALANTLVGRFRALDDALQPIKEQIKQEWQSIKTKILQILKFLFKL